MCLNLGFWTVSVNVYTDQSHFCFFFELVTDAAAQTGGCRWNYTPQLQNIWNTRVQTGTKFNSLLP